MTEDDPRTMALGAVLDFEWDWSDWLAGVANDTIVTKTVDQPTGLSKGTVSEAGGKVSCFLTLATDVKVGTVLRVPCTIVTAGGRNDTRSIWIQAVRR